MSRGVIAGEVSLLFALLLRRRGPEPAKPPPIPGIGLDVDSEGTLPSVARAAPLSLLETSRRSAPGADLRITSALAHTRRFGLGILRPSLWR